MLKLLDAIRLEKSGGLDRKKRSALGQFMTPSSIAEFMASLFEKRDLASVRLLDAGAGLGSLSTAFVLRSRKWNSDFSKLSITAFEIDNFLKTELENLFACMSSTDRFSYEIEETDFIEEAAHRILFGRGEPFTHAILNPPYKKLNSDSRHRSLLRSVGIETVNLYSAFVALAIRLLGTNGQLVAIVPRSFCNGPYYKSFRKQIIRNTAIKRIHLFSSRNKAFKDDDVLQENVIIALEKGGIQKDVSVSTSTDATFSDLEIHEFPFSRIRYPNDPENFLHIPTSTELDFHEVLGDFRNSLSDLFIEVSTGPVVDFRMREYALKAPNLESVPLLYPGHFEGSELIWPRENWKKPNALIVNGETRRWLYPTGYYTVVRRFSSKEEKRRIRAVVFSPQQLPDYKYIGFENHLNVFHFRKEGIDPDVAYGLSVFLNTTAVDKYFRRLNGHTQVNATDLRRLKYPSISTLKTMGKLGRGNDVTNQETVDAILERVTQTKCTET